MESTFLIKINNADTLEAVLGINNENIGYVMLSDDEILCNMLEVITDLPYLTIINGDYQKQYKEKVYCGVNNERYFEVLQYYLSDWFLEKSVINENLHDSLMNFENAKNS